MQAAAENRPDGHVLETPIWITIIRGVQFFLSLVILGLAGRLMHDLYLDEFGLSVSTAVLSWLILSYVILTEKVPSWRAAYHVVAVLVLEGFLVVMWLATFAAVAARRATFSVSVQVGACYDDGSAINSKTCTAKRALYRRDYLFKSGQAMMSAIAGLGALLWFLYIATFVWTAVMFFRGRKQGRFPIGVASSSEPLQMEPKLEQGAPMTPMMQQHQQRPAEPQPTGEYKQTAGNQEAYQQHQPRPAGQYQPAPSPYQQQAAYQAAQEPQAYHSSQYPQQHAHRGSELPGTPAAHQAYTPPPATAQPPAEDSYYPQQQQQQQQQ
ncbi:uncharacterized protein UV8b_01464 [Ustilaginoidea virens]|uniref:MARVEL domain-containing protein n=1 Tax=Ustilaginoidea virens TaxID=1159556 RepID=A0A1B5L2E7_USTVR|nr:uncharacterized protein UV8b_01464 [Ustilaginoidea virens]QUC17223.1 hypothetical protein UV8b_01464 [Ustilaginoidea virens]GAO16601.1 hypothetical protein UVI_02019610 [Ustilaginoidea virens]